MATDQEVADTERLVDTLTETLNASKQCTTNKLPALTLVLAKHVVALSLTKRFKGEEYDLDLAVEQLSSVLHRATARLQARALEGECTTVN